MVWLHLCSERGEKREAKRLRERDANQERQRGMAWWFKCSSPERWRGGGCAARLHLFFFKREERERTEKARGTKVRWQPKNGEVR